MKKINKKDILTIFGILGVIVIICSNFLQMHFSSDTFVLYQLGLTPDIFFKNLEPQAIEQ